MRHIAIWNVNENKVASFETISPLPLSRAIAVADGPDKVLDKAADKVKRFST